MNANFSAVSQRGFRGAKEPLAEFLPPLLRLDLLIIFKLKVIAIMTHTELRFIEARFSLNRNDRSPSDCNR